MHPTNRAGSAATRAAGAGDDPKALLCLVPREYRNLEDAAVTPAAGQVGQVKSQSAVCQATVCAHHQRESGVGGVRREGRSGKTAEDEEERGCDRKTKARAFQVVMSPVGSGQDVEVPKAPAQVAVRGLLRRIRTTDALSTISECMLLPCQVGRWPLKKSEGREERGERQGIGQRRGRDRVAVANMGAERGVTAALALFFFLLGVFFPCQPWPTSSFLSSKFSAKCSNRQARAVSVQLAGELQLDLASTSWFARSSSTPSSTASFRLPFSTSAQMQSKTPHTTSTRSTHTHAHIHGTRYTRQPPVPLRRSSLSNISTTRPSLSLSSLSPQPVNGEPNPAIVSNDVAGFASHALPTAHHLPGSYPISQSPEAPACGAERATRAEETSSCTPQGGPGGCIYRHPLQRLQISNEAGSCGSCGSV